MRKIRGGIAFAMILVIAFANTIYAKVTETGTEEFDVKEWARETSKNISGFNAWSDSELHLDGYMKSEKDNAYIHYTVVSGDLEIGYVITSNDNRVIEFANNMSPYSAYIRSHEIGDLESTKLYYVPGFHGICVGDIIVPIEETEYAVTESSCISDHNIMAAPPLDPNIVTKKINGVPDYPYTVSCIPTAIGNVLGYWSTHGYPNLITTNYSDMIQDISLFMGVNTANGNIPTAVNLYCHQASRYPSNFTATNVWNPGFNAFKTQIDANHPTLVGFSGGAPYNGPHMTTGMGYYYNKLLSDRYIYVHDAWATTATDYYIGWTSYNDFLGIIVP